MAQIDSNKVKPGTYIIIDGEPCKVKSVDKSKPGKHGSAKCRIMATGVFDGRSRTEIRSTGHMFITPDVTKKVGQVLSVNGNIAQIMDLQSYETFEMDTSGKEIKEGEEVTYWQVDNKRALEI